MSNRHIKFIGTLTTLSPVAVNIVGEGKNIKGATKMPVTSNGTPYLPSTSIRGMLRHIGHAALVRVLHKNDQLLSVDQHYMLGSGIDSGRVLDMGGNGYETIGKNINVRKINPMLSLFGNFKLDGHVKIGSGYCEPNTAPLVVIGKGARGHLFNRNQNMVNFVGENELAYLQAIMTADAQSSSESAPISKEIADLRRSLKTLGSAEKTAVFQKIDELIAQKDAIQEKRVGSKNSIARPLDGFEAIDVNEKLSHRMSIDNATDDELEFLLWVLYKASADFTFGGHANLGCGNLAAEWNIIETTLDDPMPKKLGRLVLNDEGFQLEGIAFDPAAIEKKIVDGTFDFSTFE